MSVSLEQKVILSAPQNKVKCLTSPRKYVSWYQHAASPSCGKSLVHFQVKKDRWAIIESNERNRNRVKLYLKSVSSRTNFIFSSLNSVIETVGWLAYGIVICRCFFNHDRVDIVVTTDCFKFSPLGAQCS